MADTTINAAHFDMFNANVKGAIARQGGLLRPLVSNGAYSGDKSQVVSFIGPITFRKRETIFETTKVTEVAHTSRWVSADDYDVAILVDKVDTLRTIYDPTNPYVERIREANGRVEDDVIISAFTASAKAGRNGTDLVAFPAGNVIANGGTRMSVAKLRATRKLLKKKLLDLRIERPLIALTCEQADDLLGETVVGSEDYNAIKPLVDGEVNNFMGFTFVPVEAGLPSYVAGNTIRQCPVWVPSGMHFGDWQALQLTIGPRADLNNITQIHGTMALGATRLEEEKVLTLECVE